MKKTFLFFLAVFIICGYFIFIFLHQSKVEVRKPLEEQGSIFNDPKQTNKDALKPYSGIPTGSDFPQTEIPLSKLDVPINKEIALLDLDIYFRTANIQESKSQYQGKIVEYKEKQTDLIEQAAKSPQKYAVSDKPAPTFSDTVIPKKNEGVTSTKEGSRILEDQMYESISWQKMKEDSEPKNYQEDRIMKTELPRKFQNFSLGDKYQTSNEYINVRNDVNWKDSILESAEGRLFHKSMYYFVLNFKSTVDPYYLSVILQNLFGETEMRTIGTYLVFDWVDAKTRIEYTIYSEKKCRLHFYDIALGLEKTKSN